MNIPEPTVLKPSDDEIEAKLTALRGSAGIYALFAHTGTPHLGWSHDLARRLSRFLRWTTAKRGDIAERLRERLDRVHCWRTGSRLETLLLLYELSRAYFPENYLEILRLRMPWFVGFADAERYPRLQVINRIPRRGGRLFGPFRTRDLAQAYEQQVLGLFQIRRCTETLTPDPDHPGCVYGEMNQCLRPCQCAVTVEEYATEARRIMDFIASNGRSAAAALSTARERACEEMDFEQAAQIHKRIEKIDAAASCRDAVVSEVDQFNGVALTQSETAGTLKLWPMLAGCWQEPIALTISLEDPNAVSLDRQIRYMVGDMRGSSKSSRPVEELAIFCRWYYSSSRDGQWFPFRRLEDVNYRKLVREISKMAKVAS